MSRSYKKIPIIKDVNTFSKKLGNKKFRRKSKAKLKNIDEDTILPITKSEVVDDWDVTDWKWWVTEFNYLGLENKELKGKNKKVTK